MTHVLKTWPEYYDAIIDRLKTFELRRTDDRTFTVGDELDLREWNPATKEYTGREATARVSYVLTGPIAPDGFAVMSIDLYSWTREPVQPATRKARTR